MAVSRLYFTVLLSIIGLVVYNTCESAVVVSGSDHKVQAASLCIDSTGQNIVLFWESRQFASGSEHLRFNRSTNGGKRWRSQPMDFPLNTDNPWFSDYQPALSFDSNDTLRVLWSFRNDQQAPCFTSSGNLGDTWTARVNIGKTNLPRKEGLALCSGTDPSRIWAVYNDFDWNAYLCTSVDAGKSWVSTGMPAAGNPNDSFCSDIVSDGEHLYILRISGNRPQILSSDGTGWSVFTPEVSSDSVCMAENHTIAVDSKHRIYAVYAESGRVWCLRSDDYGRSFPIRTAVASGESVKSPVLTITRNDSIAIAWEQGSRIYFSISNDAASTFPSAKPVSESNEPQTAPDIVSSGESLFFSYVQGGSAWFSGVPEVPAQLRKPVISRNLLDNPHFESFIGSVPRGWKVDSWNQEFLKERFGKGRPGWGGRGYCLEMKEGNGASVIEFTGPNTAIESDAVYVLKGFYTSTCEKLDVIGTWLDKNRKEISSFVLTLPETQDRWIEFFDEINSPVNGVYLQLHIRKRWQTGRARFDNLSLRTGTLMDYSKEFSLPPLKPGELRFPIFGWCTPGAWTDGNTYPLNYYNSERAFAEYAVANFTVGSDARFGTMRQAGVAAKDEDLAADGKDSSVIWIHGGDEPSMSAFAELAKVSGRVRRLAPGKPYMMNLLPTYGFPSYTAYEEYLDSYIKAIKPRIFTYDFYSLAGPANGYSRDFFANFELVRKHALKNNIDWGAILLMVAHGGQRSPSDAELRWQAFNSLAYGSKALGWFTYLTEVEYGGWNWRDAIINWDGTRTRHYSMIKRLNGEILKLGNILLRLKSTGVYHTKPLPEMTHSIRESGLVRNISSGQWTVGEFIDTKNIRYLMIVNRDYSRDQSASIYFSGKHNGISVFNVETGKWIKVTGYDSKTASIALAVSKGDARLFRLE